MKRVINFCCGTLAAFLALVATAHAEVPQLAAEDVIAMTHQLEQRPLAQEADGLRQQLFDWTRESDAVMINICDVLGPIPSHDDVPYGKELLVQSFFGNAVFQLQHPDNKADEFKAQLAGITSMLKAYRNIIKQDDSAHIQQYDQWLQWLDKGTLAKQLRADITSKCVAPAADGQNQFAYNF